MELRVMDTNFDIIGVIDDYESSIWTERYSQAGEFELYTPVTERLLALLKQDYYIFSPGKKSSMIIEEVKIESDTEQGNHLTVTGRSVESILSRRIIWDQTTLNGDLQGGILTLLNQNVISPTVSERRINGFVFKPSDDPRITALKLNAQFTGDNLYEAMVHICELNNLGFSVTLTQEGKFIFELYMGVDRSYNQQVNPYVIFSPGYDNLINSNYFESRKTMKTVTLVAGEGEGANRKRITVQAEAGGNFMGILRRELYTDARDISSQIPSGGTLSLENYNKLLTERGKRMLSENVAIKNFEGQVEATQMHIFGEDFFMGDIVQIQNEYGFGSRARVTELVTSQTKDGGTETYPTFTTII